MQEPLVSIIIPTYNRAHLIGETLNSVLAQTYSNWECIVVDDGSTDNTPEVLAAYCAKDSRFQYHKRPLEKPKGANACRNYGFELSKGEYVNWFDSDDVMHEKKLSVQIGGLLNSNLDYSICQSLVFEDSIDNIIGYRSEIINSEDIFYDFLTTSVVWLTGIPVWRKAMFKKFDYLFDEELQAAQEWEFFCRILLKNKNYTVVNESLVYIRKHKDNITFNSKKELREWNYFLARKKVSDSCLINGNQKAINYLKKYFINYLKNFLKKNEMFKSVKFYKKFIFQNKRVSTSIKLYFFCAFFSYLFFRKGDVFLSKIRLE